MKRIGRTIRIVAARGVAGALLSLAACSGGGGAGPAPGTIDREFARDGLFIADTGPVTRSSVARFVTTDSAGRIWATGVTTEPGNAIHFRLFPDGQPDPAFGSGGRLLDPPSANDDELFAVYGSAIFPDQPGGGALLFAGAGAPSCITGPSCGPAGGFRIVMNGKITRVENSGAYRVAYGIGGVATVGAESVLDAALEAGGRLLVVMQPRIGAFSPAQPLRIVRTDASGVNDADFEASAAGALICPGIEPGAPALARITVLADGRILVVQSFVAAAPGSPRLCVSRLASDGSPDASWGAIGRAVLDEPVVPAQGVLNLVGFFGNADGSAEVAVAYLPETIDSSRPQFSVIPLMASGRLDAARFRPGAFAGSPAPVGLVTAFSRDKQGRYLVAGFPITAQPLDIQIERPRITRYRADGTLDESFGASGPGYTELRFEASAARLAPRSIHATGETVVVGGNAVFDDRRLTPGFAIARFHYSR